MWGGTFSWISCDTGASRIVGALSPIPLQISQHVSARVQDLAPMTDEWHPTAEVAILSQAVGRGAHELRQLGRRKQDRQVVERGGHRSSIFDRDSDKYDRCCNYLDIIYQLFDQAWTRIFIFDTVLAMVGKKNDLGPIGVNVSHTVRRFREERRLSYAELSRRLADVGREIPPLGLRRIEAGDRKVDVDDLVALALALNVAPVGLLLPAVESSVVPQGNLYSAEDIWAWGRGGHPISMSQPGNDVGEWIEFMVASNPLTDFSEMIRQLQQFDSGGLDAVEFEARRGNDQ
jgi:transcriptional regulator with XRE-family HTH domain